jgi:hypothetical protein
MPTPITPRATVHRMAPLGLEQSRRQYTARLPPGRKLNRPKHLDDMRQRVHRTGLFGDHKFHSQSCPNISVLGKGPAPKRQRNAASRRNSARDGPRCPPARRVPEKRNRDVGCQSCGYHDHCHSLANGTTLWSSPWSFVCHCLPPTRR